MFNWDDIGNESVVMALTSAATWVVTQVKKLRRDMDAAFEKIRKAEASILASSTQPMEGDPMTVKSTEACLDVAKVVATEVIKAVMADGFQWTDLGAYLKSDAFQAAVAKAVPAVSNVPVEVASLGLMDDLELARYAYNFATDVVAAFKTQAKKTA